MDFRFSPTQELFRDEVRAFLAATLTPEFWEHHRSQRLPGWSPEFSRAAAERGWLAVAWPEEYGGRGLGVVEQAIYMEEMAYADAPQEHHRRAIQQVGPSIMIFGSEEQKRDYLPRIASSDISFAMGLSEPDAGSDLANVSTQAQRDGDQWVVSGAKRYTSGAHYSDFLWTVARTDPDAPKHRGISMIVVPLDAEGVTVEPLIDMQGRHHFNSVYLDQVRVPAGNLVGEENRGWYVNATTMDFERSGMARIAKLRRALDRAVAAFEPALDRGGHMHAKRHHLAAHAVSVEVSRLLACRVLSEQDAGRVPNHEVSIVKLLASETSQAIHQTAVGIAGLFGLLSGDARDDGDHFSWGAAAIATIPETIAQGSSEIQRNVIATRGLGLPRG